MRIKPKNATGPKKKWYRPRFRIIKYRVDIDCQTMSKMSKLNSILMRLSPIGRWGRKEGGKEGGRGAGRERREGE